MVIALVTMNLKHVVQFAIEPIAGPSQGTVGYSSKNLAYPRKLTNSDSKMGPKDGKPTSSTLTDSQPIHVELGGTALEYGT